MTKPVNFPGNKNDRRIGAMERLEESIRKDNEILADQSNGFLFNFKELAEGLIIKMKELATLKERIAKGGKKTTKKVGANTGAKW